VPQHLRLSQFVITYGPGSILEGPSGPRIIPRPDIGLFNQGNLEPAQFEISDRKISHGLLSGSRIFRLPSNVELGKPESYYIYATKAFPEWKLCQKTTDHKVESETGFFVLFHGSYCPLCGNRDVEPIRFVRACPEGHLDDLDWWLLVHENKTGCTHSKWFIWREEGSALSRIWIICPKCYARQNFGDAYRKKWPCSGRFPEKEPLASGPYRPGCKNSSRIIQRQASNLRIPEIRTLFTTSWYTRLHNLLQITPIYHAIAASRPRSFNQLREMLENLKNNRFISASIVQEILSCPWNEINRVINDILGQIPTNYRGLLIEEFHTFIDASINGIPPVRGQAPFSPVLIEIDPNRVIRCTGLRKKEFRIVPVLRLRTVTVQIGYRREVDTENPAKVVDISFEDNTGHKWYPGVEFFGEGIFIMLDQDDGWHFPLSGDHVKAWELALKAQYSNHLFRSSEYRDELHPVFVWWHTFSHLLIREISIYAGYPSSSIRERVYIEIENNKARGGILLYAVQPGSEGTLGGLTGLVPHFQDIIERTLKRAQVCSNDPICRENRFQPGYYCGSACYGCLFLSETSCEHRNMWLDRNVLLDNLP